MQSAPAVEDGRRVHHPVVFREPAVGIEPTTARLRIGCSTTELRWRWNELRSVAHALARTRTATPFGTTPSRWRVYQFHHQGLTTAVPCLLRVATEHCYGADGARTRDLRCDRPAL